MKKSKRAKFCRFVPAVNGSPAWMTIPEAEDYLRRANEHIDKMIEYSKNSPKDLEFWKSKHAYIEYVEDK